MPFVRYRIERHPPAIWVGLSRPFLSQLVANIVLSQLVELSNGLITCVSRFGDADLFLSQKSSVTVAGLAFRSNGSQGLPNLLAKVPQAIVATEYYWWKGTCLATQKGEAVLAAGGLLRGGGLE